LIEVPARHIIGGSNTILKSQHQTDRRLLWGEVLDRPHKYSCRV
ncbi:unnamed protein product, partial [marine sediment metagenome]